MQITIIIQNSPSLIATFLFFLSSTMDRFYIVKNIIIPIFCNVTLMKCLSSAGIFDFSLCWIFLFFFIFLFCCLSLCLPISLLFVSEVFRFLAELLTWLWINLSCRIFSLPSIPLLRLLLPAAGFSLLSIVAWSPYYQVAISFPIYIHSL